ncbi:hypothetical protein [Frankia sp. CiP3]|uniref:hypothetical protein n=1 Tax=Frankia sp. CiP3 TaxID=2880971 RepID=UPI001EF3E319|nr:hypothetical protein [Frankia sp. CiP3]
MPLKIEQVVELRWDRAYAGDHVAGAGLAAFALVDQHGLADLLQLAERGRHREGLACAFGLAAYPVGDREGEQAGEPVDPDRVGGDVADRGDGDDVQVCGLAEPGLTERAARRTYILVR